MTKFRSRKLQRLFGNLQSEAMPEQEQSRVRAQANAQHPQTMPGLPLHKGHVFVTRDCAVVVEFPATTQLCMTPQGAVDLAMLLLSRAHFAADKLGITLHVKRTDDEKGSEESR